MRNESSFINQINKKMIAEELIEILQQNPKLEIVVCECKKYEDNIPLLPIHSVEIFDHEDLEPGEFKICLNFDTYISNNK